MFHMDSNVGNVCTIASQALNNKSLLTTYQLVEIRGNYPSSLSRLMSVSEYTHCYSLLKLVPISSSLCLSVVISRPPVQAL